MPCVAAGDEVALTVTDPELYLSLDAAEVSALATGEKSVSSVNSVHVKAVPPPLMPVATDIMPPDPGTLMVKDDVADELAYEEPLDPVTE